MAPALHRVVDRSVAGIEATHEAELDRRRRSPDLLARNGSTRSRLKSIGFSQSTGFPAATACSRRSACVSCRRRDQDGVHVGDEKMLRRRPNHLCARRGGGGLSAAALVDVLNRPRGERVEWAAILAACMAPMRPQPSTAIRIIGVPPS